MACAAASVGCDKLYLRQNEHEKESYIELYRAIYIYIPPFQALVYTKAPPKLTHSKSTDYSDSF